jgi:hypothetical protein
VDQVAVNVNDASSAILLVDNVVFEDLVIQRSGAFDDAGHFDDLCSLLCQMAFVD